MVGTGIIPTLWGLGMAPSDSVLMVALFLRRIWVNNVPPENKW